MVPLKVRVVLKQVSSALLSSFFCSGGRTIHLENELMDVNVIPVPEPVVHISGTSDISREYEDFKLGVRIFADVHIVMTTGSPTGTGEPVNGIENRLDHCAITVSPPLNPDHESIDVPDDLLRQLAVLGKVSPDGVEFSGAEMIYNYERVLRQVTYSNKKPAYYLNRQFRITCSELNGRFVSNEYLQTLTVIHPQQMGEKSSLSSASSEIDVQVRPQDSHRKIGVHGVEQPVFSMSSHTPSNSGFAGNQEQSKPFMRVFPLPLLVLSSPPAFDLLLLCGKTRLVQAIEIREEVFWPSPPLKNLEVGTYSHSLMNQLHDE